MKAPAAGLITQSAAAVGATASHAGEPLFRIAIDSEIELEAEVPSIHVPALVPGQTARVAIEEQPRILGAGAFRSRRRRYPSATRPGAHLIGARRVAAARNVRPRHDRGQPQLRHIGSRSAVNYRTEGASVQVVRDNVIETRLVQVGFHSDTDIEIRDGMREGDMVVANAGGSSLRDGDRVSRLMRNVERDMGQR